VLQEIILREIFHCPSADKSEVVLLFWEGVEWQGRVLREAYERTGEALEIRFAEAGKPYFHPDRGLYFSISNTRNFTVAAFANSPVGVDLECLERKVSFERIATRYFFQKESEWMQSVPPGPERAERFFQLWTAKEAVVKLDGRGLYGGGLCSCETEIGPSGVVAAGLDKRKFRVARRLLSGEFLVSVTCSGNFLLDLPPESPKLRKE